MRKVFTVLVTTLISLSCASDCLAREKTGGVTSKLTIQAPAEVIYDTILSLRKETPNRVKELEKNGDQAVLEETFQNLPFVGKAKCTYQENYTPCKSVEYHMLHSDKFKCFEGMWSLSPLPDGKGTDVQLSSHIELDLPIPFLKQVTNTQALKGVKERLERVKQISESHVAK